MKMCKKGQTPHRHIKNEKRGQTPFSHFHLRGIQTDEKERFCALVCNKSGKRGKLAFYLKEDVENLLERFFSVIVPIGAICLSTADFYPIYVRIIVLNWGFVIHL